MPVPPHALVLAEGLGTRLRPLTLVRAKAAIPVAGEPVIRRILRWLAANGVVEVVVNLHHLPATLTSVVGEGADLGVRARYSWEQPVVLGSAGGPRRALDVLGASTFLIVNGDTLTDVDLVSLANAHDRYGALVTLALTWNREPSRYGGVVLDSEARVVGFVPRGPAAEGSFHFVGVQIGRAEAFESLPLDRPANSIGQAYDALIARQPGAIRGFFSDAAFWDIGTVADYIATDRAFSITDGTPSRRSLRVDPTARITRSILWDDIDVGAAATLDACIVTDGVRVPAGSAHAHAILRTDAAGQLTIDPIDDSNG